MDERMIDLVYGSLTGQLIDALLKIVRLVGCYMYEYGAKYGVEV